MFYLTKINKIEYNGVSFLDETYPELNKMYQKLEQISKTDPIYQNQIKKIDSYLNFKTIKEELILEYKDMINDEEFCEVKEFISGKNIFVDRNVLLSARKISINEVSRYKASLIPRNFGSILKMIQNYNKGIENSKEPQKIIKYKK